MARNITENNATADLTFQETGVARICTHVQEVRRSLVSSELIMI